MTRFKVTDKATITSGLFAISGYVLTLNVLFAVALFLATLLVGSMKLPLTVVFAVGVLV